MATLFYSRLACPRRSEVQRGLVMALSMCVFSSSATFGHMAMVTSCTPALLPSVTSAMQVCMLIQYSLQVSAMDRLSHLFMTLVCTKSSKENG